MSLNPKVTVYIPSKNYSKYLEESINSVFRQTFAEWELILIDDNSDDDSFAIMQKFLRDQRVTAFRTNGIGLPAVANLALQRSHSQYLVRLDGDDFLHSNALEILCSTLDKNLDVDFVFPDYYEIDGDGRLLCLRTMGDISYFDHFRGSPPHGACTMWRTQILKNLGGYREDLKAQDGLDVWIKRRSKESFLNISLPLFYYRKHDFNLTNSKRLISNARSTLKFDAVVQSQSKPTIFAVIPCRSKFDFIPDLWKLDLEGKSLLRLAIDSCSASPLVNEIFVLGDSIDIRNEVEKLSGQGKGSKPITYIDRKIHDMREYVPLVEVLRNFIETDSSLSDAIFLVKHLHAPFVKEQEITELVCSLLIDKSTSAALVSKLDWTILSRNRYGLQVVYERNFITSNMESFYQYSNSAMATFASNLKKSSLWGPSTTFIESKDLTQFIVDSPLKVEMASLIIKRNNEN